MQRVIKSIISLLAYLTIFYNIERIELDRQNLVGIQTFVYLLVPIFIILIIWVPVIRRQRVPLLSACGLGIYIVCKLLIFPGQAILGGRFTYLTLTEAAFMAVGTYLASQVGLTIFEMNNVIEYSVFPTVSQKIYRMNKAEPLIENEFIRGRRYNYPITTLIVEPNLTNEQWPTAEDLNRAVQDILQNYRNRYLFSKLANIISTQTRQSDLVVDLDKDGRFIIVCPETTPDKTSILMDRLRYSVKEHLGVSISFGIAAFPKDALTFEAAIDKAKLNLAASSEADLILPPKNTGTIEGMIAPQTNN